MNLSLGRYLNKTILVSIPALFEDGACRPYWLLGAELNGLWLQSDDLTSRLLKEDRQGYASTAPVIFVPFAQILAVLIPTKPVPGAAHASQKSNPASNAPAADRQVKRKK
jgi:hypothetical protein